jgi:hypothetical protein
MKPTPALLAVSSLLTLLAPTAVKAEDDLLSFDLSPISRAEPAPIPAIAAAEVAANGMDQGVANNQPLPIPPGATNPPMRFHSPQQLPAGVYRRGVAGALNESTSPAQLLPPAPPLPEAQPVALATLGQAVSIAPPQPPQPAAAEPAPPPMELLDFALEPSAAVAIAQEKATTVAVSNPLPGLFEGNSDSLVAWAVGSAEGTRTPNGAINPAYFGHTDPGNRVWNMGTFSYQHGAKTPEEADQKQLARLQNQGEVLRQRALNHGMNLTLEETLNGLDLANQSPLAAIGRVGYIERLAEAKANGYEGAEAILVARTRSYINPNTGRWNAPGLGNTEPSIRRDQQRRANAVAQALATYADQNPQIQPGVWVLSPPPVNEALLAQGDSRPEPVDEVVAMWTAPGDPQTPSEAVASAADVAPEDSDPLAQLWQVTVERVAQVALSQGTAASHQIASGMRLFDPSPALSSLGAGEPKLSPGELDQTPTEPGPPDGDLDQIPAAPIAEAEAELPSPAPDSAPASAGDGVEESAGQPLAQGAATAIAYPAWAEAREGSQSTLPLEIQSDPVAGAFPDSQVFLPSPPSPGAPSAEPFLPSTSPEEGGEALVDLTAELDLSSLAPLFPASEPIEQPAPPSDSALAEATHEGVATMETVAPESGEAKFVDPIPAPTAEQETSP